MRLGEAGKSDFSCGWREGFSLVEGWLSVFLGIAGDWPTLMMVFDSFKRSPKLVKKVTVSSSFEKATRPNQN